MLLAGSCWLLRSRRGGELPGQQKTRRSLSIRPLSNRVVVIAAEDRDRVLVAFLTDDK